MKWFTVKKLTLGALFLTVLLSLAYTGCGGGGGGDDVADEGDDFSGWVGVGADGVTIFWQYFPEEEGVFGGANAVLETHEGNFLLAGWRGGFAFAERSTYFVKADPKGETLIEKQIAPQDGSEAEGIVETGTGGLTAVGYTGEGSARNLLLLSTDGSLNQQWLKTEDGGIGTDEGYALLKLKEGGYLVVGDSERSVEPQDIKIWLYKTDADGNMLAGSERFYGGPGWNIGQDVIATADGGYAVAGIGAPEAGGTQEACLVKTDHDGKQLWYKTYGIGRFRSLAQTSDGGFVLVGATDPFESGSAVDSNLLVVKTDASGTEEWRRTFGGDRRDIGKKVLIMNDGNYLAVGTTHSYSSCDPNDLYACQDVYLVKLNSGGDVLWQKVKGLDGMNDGADTAALTSDGGFVVAGFSNGRMMAAKFDANGNTVTLGTKDFTYDVPQKEGLISGTNTLAVAGASVTALTFPRQMADFVLQRYIETLDGNVPSQFCTTSGTYSWSAAPGTAPTAGTSYTLTLSDCVRGSGEDQIIFNGSVALTFNSDTSGAIQSDTYALDITLDNVSFTFTDDVGTNSIGGAMRFSRSASGGTLTEHAQHAAIPLTVSEGGETTILQSYGIDDIFADGSFSFGANGSSSFMLGSGTTLFHSVVNTPITGSDLNAPASGTFTTTAPDGSSLRLTVVNGIVTIATDTDGDSEADYSPPSQPWDDLN
jgi:hypothetical protein